MPFYVLLTAAREDKFEVIKDKAGRCKKSIVVYTAGLKHEINYIFKSFLSGVKHANSALYYRTHIC